MDDHDDENTVTTFDKILNMNMDDDASSDPSSGPHLVANSVLAKDTSKNQVSMDESKDNLDNFWPDEESSVELSFLKDEPDPEHTKEDMKSDPELVNPDDVDYGHPNDRITTVILLGNGGAILRYSSSRRVYQPPYDNSTKKILSNENEDFFNVKK